MDYIKEIANKIVQISGNYSAYAIFSDWVKACAIAISNALEPDPEVKEKREDEYMQIVAKHGKNMYVFQEMLSMLALALEEEMTDALGRIYMESDSGNKATGQFFTPYHLAKLTAGLTVVGKIPDPPEKIKIREDACGGGAMLIAIAQTIKEMGIDYQTRLKITAKDLDWNGVYMTYLQLSLLGIDAVVMQGDALAEQGDEADKYRILYTPRARGMV